MSRVYFRYLGVVVHRWHAGLDTGTVASPEVEDLFVDPDLTRRGIGRALVEGNGRGGATTLRPRPPDATAKFLLCAECGF
jgi:hypothetical protein